MRELGRRGAEPRRQPRVHGQPQLSLPGGQAGCDGLCRPELAWPGRAAPPRHSWAGSRPTWGEREQPRLQPVGPLGRLMDVLACERSPPRPVQPIHNELQFPGLPPGTSSPSSSPLPPAARPAKPCPRTAVPAGAGCRHPPAEPRRGPGRGNSARPSFCFPTGRHFPPWLEGAEV